MALVESQILNKVLASRDISIIEKNCLTEDLFPTYKDEFNFILNYYRTYGSVPDDFTFQAQFTEFDRFDVDAEDRYLLDTLKESNIFNQLAQAISQSGDLLKQNSYQALDFLQNKINAIQTEIGISCTDIISNADERLKAYQQKLLGDLNFYINSGFNELDQVLNGWQRGEEFVVVMARTGIGKSWFLIATAEAAWEQGLKIGFVSPEMTANSVGYRFDTVKQHFSNTKLTFGKKLDNYDTYIQNLKQNNNGFFVATPRDFSNKVTVSKLKVFCEVNKLDMLCIDGISYVDDERANRNDNRTTELTHISEDLMELSNTLKIPILTVVQANRSATVNKDEAPDLESVRDSDGIAYNASRVIAMRQSGGSTVELRIRKNRYGISGGKLSYNWDAEHGSFVYLPSEDDAISYRSNNKTTSAASNNGPMFTIAQNGSNNSEVTTQTPMNANTQDSTPILGQSNDFISETDAKLLF